MIDQSSFTIDNCNRVINTFSPSCRLSREILLVLTPASGKNAVFSFVRLLLVVLVMLRSRGGTSYDNCYVTTMIPPSLKYTIWLFVQMSPIASLRFMMSNKERSPCSFFDDQRQPSKKVLRHPCCHDRFIMENQSIQLLPNLPNRKALSCGNRKEIQVIFFPFKA